MKKKLEKKYDVEMIPLGKLTPNPRNSRTHSNEQVLQIAASIREFGFTKPILIDADNMIIAGHGATLAAQMVGMVTVPCIRLTDLTPAQVRAYVIADNKLAMTSGWDRNTLVDELAALSETSFDLSLTGFNPGELKSLLEDKQDTRYLEDFDIPPKPKPVWVLIATDEAQSAVVKQTIDKLKLKNTRVEISHNAKG